MYADKNIIMRSEQRSKIIFDGLQHIRKRNFNIDVCFVVHSESMCLEVIAQLKSGIVRKYLDLKLLISRLDLKLINQSFELKKRISIFQNVKFNAGKVMRCLASEMVVQTLIKRMDITADLNDVYFRKLAHDKLLSISPRGELSKKLSFEMSFKPDDVRPFQISFNSPRCSGEQLATEDYIQNASPVSTSSCVF
jgi:hypothetical protein